MLKRWCVLVLISGMLEAQAAIQNYWCRQYCTGVPKHCRKKYTDNEDTMDYLLLQLETALEHPL
jgi:hypothetical protein